MNHPFLSIFRAVTMGFIAFLIGDALFGRTIGVVICMLVTFLATLLIGDD